MYFDDMRRGETYARYRSSLIDSGHMLRPYIDDYVVCINRRCSPIRNPGAESNLRLQRADIALGQAQRAGLEHPTHNLARARLGQAGHKAYHLGPRDWPHLLADMLA